MGISDYNVSSQYATLLPEIFKSWLDMLGTINFTSGRDLGSPLPLDKDLRYSQIYQHQRYVTLWI